MFWQMTLALGQLALFLVVLFFTAIIAVIAVGSLLVIIKKIFTRGRK